MPDTRENFSSSTLVAREYRIAGSLFVAYYDAQGKLVFVLDFSDLSYMPNVLLVINPVGNRKWDDVLANDYGVDLETVRPRRDNKYQKLDIEYSGLTAYDALVTAYDNDEDINAALANLDEFRIGAARRAAMSRLNAATDTADKARDTIDKSDETINELNARVRQLQTKLSVQRKDVGREPTKQSASKILRTEAQIDATNEKIRRAKKRVQNAEKRMVDADNDADAARAILKQLDNIPVAENVGGFAVVTPVMADVAPMPPVSVPMEIDDTDKLPDVIHERTTDLTTINNNDDQGAKDMADEDVKPLFDSDPEILDEEIAFKPIEFDAPREIPAPADTPVAQIDDFRSLDNVAAPLSFTPPSSVMPVADEAPISVTPIVDTPRVDDTVSAIPSAIPSPVLDSMMPVTELPSESTPRLSDSQNDVPMIPIAPVEFTPAMRPGPVMPDLDNNDAKLVADMPAPAPMPDVAPAPMTSDFRPVSPVTGTATPVAPVGGADAVVVSQKPTILYYMMLFVLIALSIFTLWLYQKKTSDATPNLGAATPPVVEAVAEEKTVPVENSPIIPNIAPVAEVVPEPIVKPTPAPMPEPEPEPIVEPEPIPEPVPEPIVEPEPAPTSVVTEDVVIQKIAPTVVAPYVPEPTPVETVVNKPSYNVSQQENMFVASTDYDADVQYVADDTYYNAAPVAASAPVVSMAAPTITYEPQVATSIMTCDDGSMPDYNGCCTGEIFTDMEDGTFACCTPDGIQCFPPIM